MNTVCVPAQLCDPMGCSQPGSFGHEMIQARILECIATSCSRGSSQSRDQTRFSWVSCIWQADCLPSYHLGSSSEHWGACIGVGVLYKYRTMYVVLYLVFFFLVCLFVFKKKLQPLSIMGTLIYFPIISAGASPFLHTFCSIYYFQILLLIAILTGMK